MIRSPKWLRRAAMGLVLLGIVHLVATLPVYQMEWKSLPLETALATVWMYVAAGLWIAGSGMILGMLAESAKHDEPWSGALARGVANFLLVGAILAPALMWSNPFAWVVVVLVGVAWWASRKPVVVTG